MTCVASRAALEVGRLVGQSRVGADLLVMEVEAPETARAALPGQFVHVTAGPGMLRRPFSVYRAAGGMIEILYRIKGAGTRLMAAWQAGAPVDLLGPLGSSFAPPRQGERLLLVAGGVGVAPLAFFVERFGGKGTAVVGCRTESEAGPADRFVRSGYDVAVTTDLVTSPLRALPGRFDRILTCGPWPMMAAVAEFAAQRATPCEAALEKEMGCGIGACQGCAVETARGYVRVCTEGPVMDAGGVKWNT